MTAAAVSPRPNFKLILRIGNTLSVIVAAPQWF